MLKKSIVVLLACCAGTCSGMEADQAQVFSNQGYLIVENFLSNAEVEGLKLEIQSLVEGFDPYAHCLSFDTDDSAHGTVDRFFESADSIEFFFETEAHDAEGILIGDKQTSINKVGHALHLLNPTFAEMTYSSKVLDVCSALGISDPVVVQSMYIFKQPRIGGQVPVHQDSTFVYTEPDTLLGFWVALDDATLENGCLWMAPGEHVGALRKRWELEGEKMHFVECDSEDWPMDKMIPIPVSKGSLVLIHGKVPHMSYANSSDRPRHAYTFHVMDRSSHYSELNWLQRSDLH